MPDSDSSPAIPAREEPSTTGGDSESPTPVSLLPTPPTEASFQFNQQNIQQIPQSALDRLSPEQLTGLMESTLRHTENGMSVDSSTRWIGQKRKAAQRT